MEKKKVELLAPAGDFSCFMAAVNAGADAVYLGGTKFGARAYANNFTDGEIIEALKIAHLFDKKIYLTVNTLVKQRELNEVVPYIEPFYNAGLDGVIVQDIGVMAILHRAFPQLALHASTQMTITGYYGAAFLKNIGVSRIVPARELSIEEIKNIKKQTNIEIEAFVHGAMCYAYSGQCLFSSIIGGRSGNRGRCAGPCRLPYTDEKGKTTYPLSLKDMYTLPILPKLIAAGIDSFKIEGRMKSPEYVAGVTAIYRKYMDKYYANPQQTYQVAKEDEIFLRHLYIRTDICQGYYEQHNSKSMVTIKEPGYSGTDPAVLETIRQQYLTKKPEISVQGFVTIYIGEKPKFTLSCQGISVTAEGESLVSQAQKQPLTRTDIEKRFCKMGDTFFKIEQLTIETDNKSFLPVKILNELRRQACTQLEEKLLTLKNRERTVSPIEMDNNLDKTANTANIKNNVDKTASTNKTHNFILTAAVITMEQLEEVLQYSTIQRIYLDADLFIKNNLGKSKLNKKTIQNKNNLRGKSFYLALPYILRRRSYPYLSIYQRFLEQESVLPFSFEGVLVRNLEELQWLNDIGYKGKRIADFSIGAWNREAEKFFLSYCDQITASIELNKKELQELSGFADMEYVLYGRLPLMFSANCMQKTVQTCIADRESVQNIYCLTDRYNNVFPILQNCCHCYNILYNSVPLSLHGQFEGLRKQGIGSYRLDFTIESSAEVKKILAYYCDNLRNNNGLPFPLEHYTNGHYKRGVE